MDPAADRRRAVSRQYIHDLQQRIIELEGRSEHADPGESSHTFNDAFRSPDRPIPHPFDSAEPPVPSAPDASHPNPSETDGNGPDIGTCGDAGIADSDGNDDTAFFGRTSLAHVGSPITEDWESASMPRASPDILIDPSSVQLREHLLASFFQYQALWVEIANRENFEAAKLLGPSRWYSDFLENAMLASATRLSTSKAVRALGPEFARLARADMAMALDDPSPASLQGFLILSEFEVTRGQDRIGWMFCGAYYPVVPSGFSFQPVLLLLGMACRMIPDLGLHDFEDALSYSVKRLELAAPASSRDLLYSLCCACVVYETVWSLYLGRPSSITKAVIDAVSIRCKEQRSSDSPQLNAWVGLCIPTLEVSRILNCGEPIAPGDSRVLAQLNHELEDWHARLPPALTWRNRRIGELDATGYGLHTQYCKLQILINKAMVPAHDRRRRRASTSAVAHAATLPEEQRHLVHKYATCVANLLLTYREMYGAGRIPSIMLDNAILAATCLKEEGAREAIQSDERDRDAKRLRSLIGVLEEVEPHFPITRRMVDTLKESPRTGEARVATTGAASIGQTVELDARAGAESQFSMEELMHESWMGLFDEATSSDYVLWESIESEMPELSNTS